MKFSFLVSVSFAFSLSCVLSETVLEQTQTLQKEDPAEIKIRRKPFEEMTNPQLSKFIKDRGVDLETLKTREELINKAVELRELPAIEMEKIEKEIEEEKKKSKKDYAEAEYNHLGQPIQIIQDIFASQEMMVISRRIKEYILESKAGDPDTAYEKLQEEYPRLQEYARLQFHKIYLGLPRFLFNPNEEDEKRFAETGTLELSEEEKKQKEEERKKKEAEEAGGKKEADEEDVEDEDVEEEEFKEEL